MTKEEYIKNYDVELKKISNAIINKKLIIFVGSGISSTVKNINDDYMPLWAEFLNQLKNEIKRAKIKYSISKGEENQILFEETEKMLSSSPIIEFEKIAENIKTIMTESQFFEKIKDTFTANEDSVKSDPNHKLIKRLAVLGANKFITTNYDNNILTVTKDNDDVFGKICEYKPVDIFIQYKVIDKKAIENIRQRNSYIYKLHGSDIPVLAQSEYDKLYGEEEFKNLMYDLFNNYLILFLGASLDKDRTADIFKDSKYHNAYAVFHKDNKSKENYYKELDLKPIYVDDFRDIQLILEIIKEKTERKYEEQTDIVINNPKKIDTDSAKKFFNEAKEAKECIFFNVQVDFRNWFTPNLQYHLNLQKAAFRFNKLLGTAKCYNMNDSDSCKNVVPRHSQSRIFFVYYKTGDFTDQLREEPQLRLNVESLVNIHKLSDCALAFVTVDEFATIILNNVAFFTNKENLQFLGLADTHNVNTIIGLIKANNKKQLISDLKLVIQKQNNQFKNESIVDDLDFAYLEKEDGTKLTWEADVFKDVTEDTNTLKYYASTDIKTVRPDYPLNVTKRSATLKEFVEIMRKELFIDISVHDFSKRNKLIGKQYLDMNPQILFYKEVNSTNPLLEVNEYMILKEKYDAFKILNDIS